jgi:glycerophosphoryl diester phosphodiesterase
MAARRVWVVGHRGASGDAPENTLAAFRLAARQGAQFIETDLQATRDGAIVALHDAQLRRTTNGRGAVARCRLEQLQELDAGRWFGRQWAGERIPTLGEILALARELDVVFCLELKPAPARSPVGWFERAVVAEIQRSGEFARTAILSFDPEVLRRIRSFEPSLMTGLNLNLSARGAVERAVEAGARMLCPRRRLVTRALVERARGCDLPVVPWTVNRPEEMRRLIEMGVAGIMTDYPARLVALWNQS